MHLSIHSNGWGDYPDPKGYTKAPVHWPIEGDYVRANVTPDMVQAKMSAYAPCETATELCLAHRLERNFAQLEPLYTLEKNGGFAVTDPRGPGYLAGLLARGASDLRDDLVDAWRGSLNMGIGHEQRLCGDLLAGHEDLYAILYGKS